MDYSSTFNVTASGGGKPLVMRLCQTHWGQVTQSFGHTEIADLKARHLKVIESCGGDAWAACFEVMLHLLPALVDPAPYENDLAKLQRAVEEKAAGCPVCFVGEVILTKAVEHVQKNISKALSTKAAHEVCPKIKAAHRVYLLQTDWGWVDCCSMCGAWFDPETHKIIKGPEEEETGL